MKKSRYPDHKGSRPLPKRMNFRKSSKRPMTPPPHFRKIMLQIFSEIHDRRIVYNGKNLQQIFLDWKWPLPPLWNFSENSSVLEGVGFPYHHHHHGLQLQVTVTTLKAVLVKSYLCSMSMHWPSLQVNWPGLKSCIILPFYTLTPLLPSSHFNDLVIFYDQPAEHVVSLIGFTLEDPTTVLHLSSRTPEKSTSCTPG